MLLDIVLPQGKLRNHRYVFEYIVINTCSEKISSSMLHFVRNLITFVFGFIVDLCFYELTVVYSVLKHIYSKKNVLASHTFKIFIITAKYILLLH